MQAKWRECKPEVWHTWRTSAASPLERLLPGGSKDQVSLCRKRTERAPHAAARRLLLLDAEDGEPTVVTSSRSKSRPTAGL